MKKAVGLLVLLPCLLGAAEEMDMEARRESVETLRTHIGMRQERLADVVKELRERAKRTDEEIGKVVDLLAGLKDSQDSKRRIAGIKGEAIGGLKGMIGRYDKERRKIVEELRTGAGASEDDLAGDLKVLDELIQKRSEDVVRLVKSMPAGEDVAKYEQSGEAYFNGIHYENSRISEAWRQSRRDRVESDKQRRELEQALKEAIEDLERRRDAVAAALEGKKFNEAEKALREQELARVNGLLEARRGQLREVATPSEAPEAAADKGQADDLKAMFEDARHDIAADFSRTLRLYHEAAAERERITGLRQRLDACEAWLKEHGEGGE